MGINLGKALKKVGKTVSKAASFVPGSPIGLVGSASNAALSGKNVGQSVVSDLSRNAKGAATLLPIALSGGMGAAPALSAGGAAAGGGAAAAGGGGGFDLMGTLSKIGGFARDNSDLLLAGGAAIAGLDQQRKGDRYDAKALAEAERLAAELAPLRTMGIDQLRNPGRINLSGRLPQSSNPFARRAP